MRVRFLSLAFLLGAITVYFWPSTDPTVTWRNAKVAEDTNRIGIPLPTHDGRSIPSDRTTKETITESADDVSGRDVALPAIIGKDGTLTRRTIERLGLSVDDSVFLQEAVDSLFRDLTDIAVANATEITPEEEREDDRTIFRIAPFPDESEKVMEEFANTVRERLGTESSEEVIELVGDLDNFAYMGRFELIAAFQEFQIEEGLSKIASHYSIVDPATNRILEEGDLSYTSFVLRFGDIFDVRESRDRNQ
ncbi:MAG: hypothetical protein KDN22_29100 [Verrucomicrobiae bacterium]|nr:hypothetical protein [Verrucomicrobiae bacterium]